MRTGVPNKRRDKVPVLLGKYATGSNNGTRATVRFFNENGLLIMTLEDLESGATMRFTPEESREFLRIVAAVVEAHT